jgi:hypothetical protein
MVAAMSKFRLFIFCLVLQAISFLSPVGRMHGPDASDAPLSFGFQAFVAAFDIGGTRVRE